MFVEQKRPKMHIFVDSLKILLGFSHSQKKRKQNKPSYFSQINFATMNLEQTKGQLAKILVQSLQPKNICSQKIIENMT